ncbi:hypothetical protein [uncultured Fibrella sp.]|uniref:hypothetical protein n=1 Tax=uncultured Fibrella sp. TaxID=1284596 RepID=UPI0035C9E9DA
MKKQVRVIALAAFSLGVSLLGATTSMAQRYDDNRVDDRRRIDDQYDNRDSRRDDRLDTRERELRDRERQLRDRERDLRRDDSRRGNDVDERIDSRRDFRSRQLADPRYDNDFRDRNSGRQYGIEDLSKAYDEGFDDGQKSSEKRTKQEHRENYKNFTLGLYGGANSTRFQGESLDANGNATGLAGRLGYQLGFFVRGGGRFYGQIGAEYLTSSSEFYSTVSTPGSGTTVTVNGIISNVDQQYLHVPAYVGVKLAQSERGVSGIRLQVGAEFATPLGGRNATLNIDRSSFNDATLNGLANIGFDAGPLFIDFVYHHGFQNVLRDNTSNSQRRILGVNVGVKF